MYAVNPSLTFVHFLFWYFLALFAFFLREKNLSNIRLQIKYIILGVDHFASIIFEIINYNKFVETLKRRLFQRNQTA